MIGRDTRILLKEETGRCSFFTLTLSCPLLNIDLDNYPEKGELPIGYKDVDSQGCGFRKLRKGEANRMASCV